MCGRLDLAISVSRLKWKAGNEGTVHDISFTSDILIITLLSNFLLQYVESKLGLGMATEQTGRKQGTKIMNVPVIRIKQASYYT